MALSLFLSSVCLSLQVIFISVAGSNGLQIISRSEWSARPPKQPLPALNTPVPYVIISHTASRSCSTLSQCSIFVRNIQTHHMANMGMWDIAYNFLVGGDGFAYEGRGWNSEGSHTKNYNGKSMGISFVGTFHEELPPQKQIEAAQKLIELGVEKGYIANNYKLLGARQVTKTLSPGEKLFENIKTWPNWSPNP